MRRVLVVVAVLALMLLGTSALAEYGWQNYKDTFSSGGYAGNDGSLDWGASWKEVGESDGPSAGKVRVTGSGCQDKCLSIGAGLLGLGAGAYRLADTGDFANGELSYTVGFDGGGLLGLGTATLSVQATSTGGDSWSTVDTVVLGSASDTQHRSVSVSGFMSEKFGVRFLVTGALGAEVLIDNVEVAGEIPPPTTTTTFTTTTTTTTLPPTTLPKVTTTTLITLPPPTLPNLSTTSTTTTKTTTTTTTAPTNTRSTTTTTDPQAGGPTTTIDVGDTTTTVAGGGGGGDDDPGDDPGGDEAGLQSGLRPTSIGVESDVPRGLFGSMPEVLGFEVTAGYANTVELIEASWVWVLGLALMIAAALIKGIDRRVDPETTPDSTA